MIQLMLHAHHYFHTKLRLFAKHLKASIIYCKFRHIPNIAENPQMPLRNKLMTSLPAIQSFPKFQKLSGNKKKYLEVRVTSTQKVQSFRRYLKNLGGSIFVPISTMNFTRKKRISCRYCITCCYKTFVQYSGLETSG